VIEIINDLHEEKIKHQEEREDNIIQQQSAMIDNFYRERCTKLEEQVKDMEAELHEWRNKFIALEESYAEEIEALNNSFNQTSLFEGKIKELEDLNAHLKDEITRRRSIINSPRGVKFEAQRTIVEEEQAQPQRPPPPKESPKTSPKASIIVRPTEKQLVETKKKEIKPKVNTRR
jgi:chromosome segregation ATPase